MTYLDLIASSAKLLRCLVRRNCSKVRSASAGSTGSGTQKVDPRTVPAPAGSNFFLLVEISCPRKLPALFSYFGTPKGQSCESSPHTNYQQAGRAILPLNVPNVRSPTPTMPPTFHLCKPRHPFNPPLFSILIIQSTSIHYFPSSWRETEGFPGNERH
jgi:hypothetical protein